MALADIARKKGLLALEGQEITNDFMKQGIGLCVDGHDPALVQRMLGKEIDLMLERHEVGINMFKNMAAIGPAMAVALLTTLYGAVIANAFAQPIADKLTVNGQ